MANMMFEMSSSSVMLTLPTATPKQSTFFSWNLIVDLTSVTLAARSSLWPMGVGNLPAASVCQFPSAESWPMLETYPWKDQDPRDEGSS